MKLVKMFGLLAMAAAALMAFAGTASATSLTGEGVTLGVGAEIHAVNESAEVTLTGPLNIAVACQTSTVAGKITETGGTEVKGNVEALTFENCTNGYVVDVNTKGTLSINSAGTTVSNGAEVTVTNVPIVGTCIYKTNNTDIGTLTPSSKTGSTATFDISAAIPRSGGSALCGSTGTWEGSYKVTKPDTLNID